MELSIEQNSVSSVRAIYDRAYAHPGLMGTHFDKEYSEVTKTRLLALCKNAPNHRLLDMGTGDGDLWEFAQPSWEWHGTDISRVGCQRAGERFPKLHAAVATAEYLPYPTGYFGAVVAADTVEHVFNPVDCFREVRRILAPNGTFALSVPTPDSLRKWAYNRLLRQRPSAKMIGRLLQVVAKRKMLFGQVAFQPIDRDLSVNDWQTHLEAAGFELFSVAEWPATPLQPLVYLLGAKPRH